MTKKLFQILSLASISSFILLFNSDDSRSCGGWDYMPDDVYAIFNPEIINQPSLEPFLLSGALFYPKEDSILFNEKIQNLLEWEKYFNNKIPSEDLEKIIYSASLEDIQKIKNALLQNDYSNLHDSIKTNALINYWKNSGERSSLDYLVYAKECEPQVVKSDYWEEIQRDTLKMLDLIQKGKSDFSLCTDKQIKQRYAFQIIRLAHYTGNYESAVDMYDSLVAPLKLNNLITNWSLSLKAGALKRSGKQAESNYLFSVVFDNCPTRRYAATFGFKVDDDSIFNSSITLCKNEHEKTSVWLLYAYKNENEIEAIRQIYSMEPKSPYLELMLAREVVRVEREKLPPTNDYYTNYHTYLEEKGLESIEKNKELLRLVLFISEKKNTLNPHLWYLSAGYLSTLLGDYYNAGSLYYGASVMWPKEDNKGKEKIKLFEIINKILSEKKYLPGAEASLVQDLKWLYEQSQAQGENSYSDSYYLGGYYSLNRKEMLSAFLYVRSLLASAYASKGEFIKMHLLLGDSHFNYNLEGNPKNEPLDNLIEFLDKPGKTDFENLLAEMYCIGKFDLLYLKGTALLNQHKFKEAIEYFEKSGWAGPIQADPFVIYINDNHDRDIRDTNHTAYTKLSFCKKMLELEKSIKKDPKRADKYYYMLANGYYNISYYGNCWDASSFWRDFDSWGYREGYDWQFYDCSTAQSYYEKAMKATKNKEFAAKCCFMAAKCEQNTFYNNWYKFEYDKNTNYGKEKSKYRTYFKVLANKYSNTKFYKEALAECKYFNEFVNVHLNGKN